MVLDELQGRLPDAQSHWVFAGNRVRDLDDEFPVAPLTITRSGFATHPDCPVCNHTLLNESLPPADQEKYEHEIELAWAVGDAVVEAPQA